MDNITNIIAPCIIVSSFFTIIPGNLFTIFAPSGTKTMNSGGYNILHSKDILLYGPNYICHAIIFMLISSPIFYYIFKYGGSGKNVLSTVLIIFVAGCLFTCLSPGAIYNLPPVDTELKPDGLYQMHNSESVVTRPLNYYVHTACFFLVIYIYFNILKCNNIDAKGMIF
jgi:hypothetical protein